MRRAFIADIVGEPFQWGHCWEGRAFSEDIGGEGGLSMGTLVGREGFQWGHWWEGFQWEHWWGALSIGTLVGKEGFQWGHCRGGRVFSGNIGGEGGLLEGFPHGLHVLHSESRTSKPPLCDQLELLYPVRCPDCALARTSLCPCPAPCVYHL